MKNGAALKNLGEKSCEIKGDGQEMAAMMLMLKILIMHGSPKFFKATPCFTAWLFLCGYSYTVEWSKLSQAKVIKKLFVVPFKVILVTMPHEVLTCGTKSP